MEAVEMVDVGDKVRHPKFGQGTVTGRAGGGESTKVTVKFGPEVGEKKLAIRYAKLRKVNERPTLAGQPETPQDAEPEQPGPEE